MSFLKRLFSRKEEEPQDQPPEFSLEEPPDWIIDLQSQGAPGSEAYWIHVLIHVAARTGTAEILISPRGGQSQQRKQVEVAKPEINRLLVILGFAFPDDITSLAVGEDAGSPVQVSIHRREPYTLRMAKYNLDDWLDARKTGPPAVEIGKIIFQMRLSGLPVK